MAASGIAERIRQPPHNSIGVESTQIKMIRSKLVEFLDDALRTKVGRNAGDVGPAKGINGSGAESLSLDGTGGGGGGGEKLARRMSAMQFGQMLSLTRTNGTIALQWGQGIMVMVYYPFDLIDTRFGPFYRLARREGKV